MEILMGILALAVFGGGVYLIIRKAKRDGML
jgi:hypothetical protein